MRRREFILALGGAAAGWPLAARAALASEASGQRGDSKVRAPDTRPEPGSSARAQPATPVVGVLNGQSRAEVADYLAAFHRALSAAGYVEGQTVAIEYRWAEGQRETFPALAADLVRRQVNVIFSSGGTPMTLAAKVATTTIPIVFAMGGDPVALSVVASLNRPGGNATGSCYFYNVLGAKRLELMHRIAPSATVIGYLVNPTNPSIEGESQDMHAAARSLGLELRVQKARNEREIEAAFSGFVEQRVDAVVAAADVQFTVHRAQLAALALRDRLPTNFHTREIVQAGGLMCYGPSQKDAYHQAGVYTGRILKGEKPADLPVQQATAFELVLNLKTARALGLEIPPAVLAIADQVIE